LDTNIFVAGYVRDKVGSWVSEAEKLSMIAISQPQVAFAAFPHTLLHRWFYIAWTTPGFLEFFHQLDEVSSARFLPVVAGKPAFDPLEREKLSLPACLGGLGIIIPSTHFSSYSLLPSRLKLPWLINY